MNIPSKKNQLHTFDGGVDSDTSPDILPANKARYMLNCRTQKSGNKGLIVNLQGNTLITTPLPDGINTTIGHGESEKTGKFYFAVWNSNAYHTWYVYDSLQQAVSILLQNLTDTGGVDILKFNQNSLINHVDVINGSLYWCEESNKARKFNIAKALDKSPTGYGTVILEDYITAYKKAPIYAPKLTYFTDTTRSSNYLYGILIKACYRHILSDGEITDYSPFSPVALPPNQSYLGVNAITYDNNCINIQVNSGNKEVINIEIAIQINSLDFVSVAVLNKAQLGIADNTIYTYSFYNDGAYTGLDQGKVQRAYSRLPDKPKCQSFVENSMVYSNFYEGFPVVLVNAKVDVTSEDLYLPPGTVNQFNNPSITFTNNVAKHGGIGARNWQTDVHIQIGFDVKKGNTFQIHAANGSGGNTLDFSYTATASDDASTVANAIKAFLRSAGRGIPDQYNGISGEGIDGSGNVYFDYTELGAYASGPDYYSGSVNPVSYQSLKDNGLSIQVIKSGSARKYGIVYFDDDGRTSLAYTSDQLLAKTPFITEWGELKRPIHTLSIYHNPPAFARYWQLVRTPDFGQFIQILIQKVIDVVVSNAGDYLDLVVGSLFTYQKMHPNTILAYEFTVGDRLRLIKDENTGALYTPFFETEILSYSIDTEELVNYNITTDGTDQVTPDKPVDAGYVGKDIIIGNYQRTIIGINSGKYVLDSNIALGSTGTPVVTPNYTFIDRRGIIRIKKPSNHNIVSLSTVEIYKPLKNSNNAVYKVFQECGAKFEIGNYGTSTAFHRGTVQDQSPTQPAIIKVTEGDAYVRNRELPTNTVFPGTQVTIDHVEDPNFSDFYESNLHNTGRSFPQDDGSGVKLFGSRFRFSNNYIQDTKINGLNDYDALDKVDYNDPYGNVQLTRFRDGYLFIFKYLKNAWTPVNKSIIVDNAGNETLASSKYLLNQIQYASHDGGIGDNPESWCASDKAQFIASANSGQFFQIAQNGTEPISEKFFYDKRTRELLAPVSQFKLRCFGGYNRAHNEVNFTIPDYNAYLFNGGFDAGQWSIYKNNLPAGTTFTIVTNPTHGTVTPSGNFFQYQSNAGYTGPDNFTYMAHLPDGTTQGPISECITVIPAPPRKTAFRAKQASAFCVQQASGVVGIIVVDFQTATDLNAVGFVSTAGTTPYNQIVYPGLNFYPNDGTPAANCWELASDQHPTDPTMRFMFNVTKLSAAYPLATSFQFKIRGRQTTLGTINGFYSLKDASSGSMIMNGSPGTYEPSTSSLSIGSPIPFTANVQGGGDGSYNLTNGADILTLDYDVATQMVTATIA